MPSYQPTRWLIHFGVGVYPEDAADAIYWSNAWPYSESSQLVTPGFFLFSRTGEPVDLR